MTMLMRDAVANPATVRPGEAVAAVCVLPVEKAELAKPKSKRVGLAGQEDCLVRHVDHDVAAL